MHPVTTPLLDVRDVLRLASARSPADHPHVGSEHLALAALDGRSGLWAIATDAGIDRDLIAPALTACCTDHVVRGNDLGQAITPRTAAIVATAAQLAWADGAAEIDASHLLRALLEEPGAVAWWGLRQAGVTPAMVFDGLVRRREGPWPSPCRATLSRLLDALTAPLLAWAAFESLFAQDGNQEHAATAAAQRQVVCDLAALGQRLCVLTPDEVADLSSETPLIAHRAFRIAKERASFIALRSN
jgi:hypothetical protein